jgi:hypothetical protein
MKIGDLVKTTCFGPRYSVGEVGVLIKEYGRIVRCWVVLFGNTTEVVAQDGLEVINAA